MTKIGVFGGTFDPVHYGHIYLARQALSEKSLDQILVVPARMQPFKQGQPVTPAMHRYKIVELAFKGTGGVFICDAELKNEEVSYTIDTLRKIKKKLSPDTEIYFILGADTFLKIEKWKDPDGLLREFSFIVGTRPGYNHEELDLFIDRVSASFGAKVTKVKNKEIDVSSTEIKEMIKSGKSLSGLVPARVERYIYDSGMYL